MSRLRASGNPPVGKKQVLLADNLEKAILLKRYKRFLADVQLESGATIVVHCPNPGSMISCAEPGSEIYLRHSACADRKLPYTWVITRQGETFINVDTLLANKLVAEALAERRLPEFVEYDQVQKEFTFADSRFDFALGKDVSARSGHSNKNFPQCIIEVKSTTLAQGRRAMFPDAKTARGLKHLRGLMAARRQGIRAVQFFCISRNDIDSFSPAEHIDPDYADGLRQAAAAGVEIMAWHIEVRLLQRRFSVSLSAPVKVFL